MSVEFLKMVIYAGSTLIVSEIIRQIRLRRKIKQMVLTTVRHNLREKYGYNLAEGLTIKVLMSPLDIITEDNFMRYYIITNKAIMNKFVKSKGLKLINK